MSSQVAGALQSVLLELLMQTNPVVSFYAAHKSAVTVPL
jgi:hypothetical protein